MIYLDEDLPGAGPLTTVDSEVAARVVNGVNLDDGRQTPRPQEQSPAQTYYEPTYTEALKHIAELYQAGRLPLSARVGPAVLQHLPDNRATVNIPVFEGPCRRCSTGVVLTGQEHISSQVLMVASGFASNARFSYLLLEEAGAFLRMQQFYQERGYMFVRIEPRACASPAIARAPRSRFKSSNAFRSTWSELIVRGVERTSVDFIRGLVTIKPGDLFRPSHGARQSELALASLGVFSGISVELEDPDLPARVKRLVVTVSERRNQFLDFGAGLSTGQGARAGFNYGYRNLFGTAIGVTLRVQFAYQLLFVREDLRQRFEKAAVLRAARTQRHARCW